MSFETDYTRPLDKNKNYTLERVRYSDKMILCNLSVLIMFSENFSKKLFLTTSEIKNEPSTFDFMHYIDCRHLLNYFKPNQSPISLLQKLLLSFLG